MPTFYPTQTDYIAQLNSLASLTNVYYLGAKTSNPTLDNNGSALIAGALYWNSAALELRVYTGTAWTAIPTGTYAQLSGSSSQAFAAAALTATSINGVTVDSTTNKIITAINVGTASTLAFDTDGTLTANSDSRIATQKAIKTYVDSAVTGVLKFKGSTDCSANPNYPAAVKGEAYIVTVAGKIGGASGVSVDVGDVCAASATNAGGTQASVGTNWFVLEHNLIGALLSSNNLSDVANAATARTNLGAAALAGSSSQAFATASITSAGSINAGTGTAGTTISSVANGGGSGAGAGSAFVSQVNTTTVIAIGNKSGVIGGAYDATPYLYGASTINTNVGMAFNVVGRFLDSRVASTAAQYMQIGNTGGDIYIGKESSVAGSVFTGSTAYAAVVYAPSCDLLLTGNGGKALLSSTGMAVTGVLSASTGFGCNGKSAQTAAASGGTLAGVISALVANGILSS